MNPLEHLRWPFFEERHRAFAVALDAWAAAEVRDVHGADVDALCRRLVRQLGDAGWLRHAVGGTAHGGAADVIDTRMLCLARETLARHAGLADFAFGMQGLGSGAITLAGTPQQKARWLPRVARGEAIAAFALSEPDAGSDVAALQCAARIDGEHAVLDGEKTWISNGGIADFYVVFVRSGEAPKRTRHLGLRRRSRHAGLRDRRAHRRHRAAPAGAPALHRLPRAAVAAHRRRWRRLQDRDAHARRVPHQRRCRGAGLRTPRAGRRPCARHHAQDVRPDLGRLPAHAGQLAQMATTIDSAALLTYRAAWQRDQGENVTRQAAMAKLAATEGAQQVIDAAVQLFGGLGVVSGHPVERLYREIRSLRIYEGASEVQQLIIGRELLKEAGA